MRRLLMLVLSLSCFILSESVLAQSVMVIPFYKKGDNKRFIIEEDACYRIIETKIKEAFLKEAEFGLIDYRAIVRRLELTDVIMGLSQTDLITLLVQNADPDIYIIADITNDTKRGSSGKQEFKMIINLTAHRSFDGMTMATTILDSGWRYYDDCLALATKDFQNKTPADKYKIEAFAESLLKMESKIRGVAMSIEFFLAEEANHNYFTALSDGKRIVQVIQRWVEENSLESPVKSNTSEKYIQFPRLLMQLKDNPEANSPTDIGFALEDYLEQLSPRGKPDTKLDIKMSNLGSNIIFHLQ